VLSSLTLLPLSLLWAMGCHADGFHAAPDPASQDSVTSGPGTETTGPDDTDASDTHVFPASLRIELPSEQFVAQVGMSFAAIVTALDETGAELAVDPVPCPANVYRVCDGEYLPAWGCSPASGGMGNYVYFSGSSVQTAVITFEAACKQPAQIYAQGSGSSEDGWFDYVGQSELFEVVDSHQRFHRHPPSLG
jgi:hypothetical protein